MVGFIKVVEFVELVELVKFVRLRGESVWEEAIVWSMLTAPIIDKVYQ